jgi:Acyl-CoA dehydrogenase, N-terminal domain
MDDVTAFDTPAVLALAADLKPRVEAVAKIAAAHADAVDRDARFPGEAFEAARKARLLSLLVPTELGGDAGTVSDAAEACHALGRACASTGMVFAMHQIMVAILVRHGLGSAWHRGMLRDIAANQWLLASSHHGRNGRRRPARQRLRGPSRRWAHVACEECDRDFLRRRSRRDRDDSAPRTGLRAIRPGARRAPQKGLSGRAAVRLGHARHARYLQRGLRPHRHR